MDKEQTIVILDDETNILKSLQRVFLDDEFIIETFESSEDALKFVKENDVDLIISDQRMPGMTGTEFLTKVKSFKPDTIRIILTGYADIDAAIDGINDGHIYKFIFKPWNDEELHSTVLRALEYYQLQQENKRLLDELLSKNEELADLNNQLSDKVKERTTLIVKKNFELGLINKTLENRFASMASLYRDLIQIHSSETGLRAKRINIISKRIANQLQVEEDQYIKIEVASLIFEIGKTRFPSLLLAKNESELTEEEIALLKIHPLVGEIAIQDVQDSEELRDIILHPSENWDGSGYPDGLAGDKIPLVSRILAISQAIDSLICENPEDCVNKIKALLSEESGKKFDPQICKTIIESPYLENCWENPPVIEESEISKLTLKTVLAEDLKSEEGIILAQAEQKITQKHLDILEKIKNQVTLPEKIKIRK